MAEFSHVNIKDELIDEIEFPCYICGKSLVSQLDLNIHCLEHDANENAQSEMTDIPLDITPQESTTNVIPVDIPEENEISFWTRDKTMLFLNEYRTHYKQVGMGKIKTRKALFQLISRTFKEKYKLNVSPTHCENRMKVLDRSYTKFLKDRNDSSKKKRYFEYLKEMEEISRSKFKRSCTVSKLTTVIPVNSNSSSNNSNITSPSSGNEPTVVPTGKSENSWSRKKCEMKLKALSELREMKKIYYTKKLMIENAKLEEMKRRNRLTQERNELIRDKLQFLILKFKEFSK